jgi:ribosomal protein S8
MKSSTFLKLCNTLKQNGYLKIIRYVKITEQVATFLLIVTHNHTHKDVCDRIQQSSKNSKPILSPGFQSALQA